MLFHSYSFFIFFPIVCILYYLIPYRGRYLFLLAASYIFYLFWGPGFLVWLAAETVVSFRFAAAIDRAAGSAAKKILLTVSVCLFLGILIVFKYSGFFAETFAKLTGRLDRFDRSVYSFAVPMGISFFTFQIVGYLADVFRGKGCEKNLIRYALFISFFPKIAQGPILRADQFFGQIEQKKTRFSPEAAGDGILRMLYGYFQKIVIADNLALIVAHVFDNYTVCSSPELITAVFAFTIQIYCDFAGYSNIAIGAGEVLGFHLPENFNTPYMSVSVADFWRRWHISLSSWFRDYVYIPLGGSRRGKLRKYINIMVVFLLSGMWHGASWHFIAWGGLNGFYQIAGDILKPVKTRFCEITHSDRNAFSHQLGVRIITFLLIAVSWIFFRANSIHDSFTILKGIFTKWDPVFFTAEGLYHLGLEAKVVRMLIRCVIVAAGVDIFTFYKGSIFQWLRKQGVWFRYLAILLLILTILVCGRYGTGLEANAFLYTQF